MRVKLPPPARDPTDIGVGHGGTVCAHGWLAPALIVACHRARSRACSIATRGLRILRGVGDSCEPYVARRRGATGLTACYILCSEFTPPDTHQYVALAWTNGFRSGRGLAILSLGMFDPTQGKLPFHHKRIPAGCLGAHSKSARRCARMRTYDSWFPATLYAYRSLISFVAGDGGVCSDALVAPLYTVR